MSEPDPDLRNSVRSAIAAEIQERRENQEHPPYGETLRILEAITPQIEEHIVGHIQESSSISRLAEDLCDNATNITHDAHLWLDVTDHRANARASGNSIAPPPATDPRVNRFGTPRALWKVWPKNAVINGAPEWACTRDASEGYRWFHPVALEELDGLISKYLGSEPSWFLGWTFPHLFPQRASIDCTGSGDFSWSL
jgi:hypothetical protein